MLILKSKLLLSSLLLTLLAPLSAASAPSRPLNLLIAGSLEPYEHLFFEQIAAKLR